MNQLIYCGAVAGVVLSLIACSAHTEDVQSYPQMAAASHKNEMVIYVKAQSVAGFQPLVSGITILSEPVVRMQKIRAEGRLVVGDLNTVIVGKSCERLLSSHDLTECREYIIEEKSYGAAQLAGVTDNNGVAQVVVGNTETRLRAKSVKTREDNKCWWTGSVMLQPQMVTADLQLQVYCE